MMATLMAEIFALQEEARKFQVKIVDLLQQQDSLYKAEVQSMNKNSFVFYPDAPYLGLLRKTQRAMDLYQTGQLQAEPTETRERGSCGSKRPIDKPSGT